jgi:hypothetical protein
MNIYNSTANDSNGEIHIYRGLKDIELNSQK